MKKYEKVLELEEKQIRLDQLENDRDKDPNNSQLKEEIISLSWEIRLLKADIESDDQQAQEGWPADQQ